MKLVAIVALVLFSGPLFAVDKSPTIQVYFSPHGGRAEAVIEALNSAKKTVLVQAYSFTSAPIAKALVEAHRRGMRESNALSTPSTALPTVR